MSKQSDFINVIAPLAIAERQNRARWVLPSVCIAQAALESGWNLKAKTLFGIKGKGASLKTTEYINGKYEQTTASFKEYPSIAASVHGYYDLITGNARYSGAVNNNNFRSAVQAICRGGYATDPYYSSKVISIIIDYNLADYDFTVYQTNTPATSGVSFQYGKDYRVTPTIGVNVRSTHSRSAKIKKAYKKGTVFTCLETWEDSSDRSIWVRTPSGWVCGYDGKAGKFYAEAK